jgi:hypothetical protein
MIDDFGQEHEQFNENEGDHLLANIRDIGEGL